MKGKLSLIALGLISAVWLAGCAGPFGIPHVRQDFESAYKPRIKRVAILPLRNIAKNKEASDADIYLRKKIFLELLERKDKYAAEIQEIAETDEILSKAGINSLSPAGVEGKNATELGQILGVDALFFGVLDLYGETGFVEQLVDCYFLKKLHLSKAGCKLAMVECESRQAFWEWQLKGKIEGNDPSLLIDEMAHWVAIEWPFRKRK